MLFYFFDSKTFISLIPKAIFLTQMGGGLAQTAPIQNHSYYFFSFQLLDYLKAKMSNRFPMGSVLIIENSAK